MTLNQLLKKPFSISHGFMSVVVGLALFLPVLSYAAYAEPSGTPPNYTTTQVPELLNGSIAAQRKVGSLLIGPVDSAKCNLTSLNPADQVGCAKICLNPNLTMYPGDSDTTGVSGNPPACIISWSQISGALINGTPLVRKFDNPTHLDFASANPADTVDNGAFSLQALPYTPVADSSRTWVVNPYAQLLTLLADAPPAASRSDSLRPTGIVADAQTGSNFAAQFSGRFAVVSDESVPHQICLNSPNGVTNCITDWSQISIAQDPTLVRLQVVSAAGSYTPDLGNTSTSGALVTETLVAGIPMPSVAFTASCGDGICTYGNETATVGPKYCPEDCQ